MDKLGLLGHSGGYYNSGDGGTGTNQAPVQVDKIDNLKEVCDCWYTFRHCKKLLVKR